MENINMISRNGMCPYCGSAFDRVADIKAGRAVPKTGQYNMCTVCGSIGRFDAEGNVRILTHAEKLAMCVDRDMLQYTGIWLATQMKYLRLGKETPAHRNIKKAGYHA